MGGAFPFPVKYGYAMVGRVEAGPAELKGRLCFALYPHQTVFNLAGRKYRAAARTACRRSAPCSPPTWRRRSTPCGTAAPGPADRIAVVGAGVLGALVARLCAQDAGRGGDAGRYRSGARPRSRKRSARRSPRPTSAPDDCDLVFHTSASGAGLATALRLAGDEATVLELSWYGAKRRDGAARRRVPSPPAEAHLQPGRQGRAIAPRRAGLSPAARRRARAAGRPACSTRCSRRRSRSPTCPRKLPDILDAHERRAVPAHPLSTERSTRVRRRSSRPHHDRPFVQGRGVRPGAGAARRDLHGRGRVHVRKARRRTASWSTSAAPSTCSRRRSKVVNYKNLDDMPEFKGVKHHHRIPDPLGVRPLRRGREGRQARPRRRARLQAIRVTVGESPNARAWYEAPLW